jgi:hypothetical protein
MVKQMRKAAKSGDGDDRMWKVAISIRADGMGMIHNGNGYNGNDT